MKPITNRENYALAALFSECGSVRRTAEGGRQNALFKAGCAVGRFVQRGDLEYSDAKAVLLNVSEVTGLPADEARRVAIAGLDTGIQDAWAENPVHAPHDPNSPWSRWVLSEMTAFDALPPSVEKSYELASGRCRPCADSATECFHEREIGVASYGRAA